MPLRRQSLIRCALCVCLRQMANQAKTLIKLVKNLSGENSNSAQFTGASRSTVSLNPLACVVPSGICLRNLFENTRDCGHHNPTLSPRAFQKISESNAQWFPLKILTRKTCSTTTCVDVKSYRPMCLKFSSISQHFRHHSLVTVFVGTLRTRRYSFASRAKLSALSASSGTESIVR